MRDQQRLQPAGIVEAIDGLRFRSQTEKHELSYLYEEKIANVGNAGRDGGCYYTPRPIIRAIVTVTAPQLGEPICGPAIGSAGFLCESFDCLNAANPKRTTSQDRFLQERTIYGKEKDKLAYWKCRRSRRRSRGRQFYCGFRR